MSKRNPPAPPAGDPPAPMAVLLGSNIHPALITINGTEHQLGEFVAAAQAASGLSVEDWNNLPGEELDRLIDAAIVDAGGASALPNTQDPPPPPQEDDADVAVLYAPEGMASCSHGGETFEVGEDGTVRVPHHAVPHLQAHGLSTSRKGE